MRHCAFAHLPWEVGVLPRKARRLAFHAGAAFFPMPSEEAAYLPASLAVPPCVLFLDSSVSSFADMGSSSFLCFKEKIKRLRAHGSERSYLLSSGLYRRYRNLTGSCPKARGLYRRWGLAPRPEDFYSARSPGHFILLHCMPRGAGCQAAGISFYRSSGQRPAVFIPDP